MIAKENTVCRPITSSTSTGAYGSFEHMQQLCGRAADGKLYFLLRFFVVCFARVYMKDFEEVFSFKSYRIFVPARCCLCAVFLPF